MPKKACELSPIEVKRLTEPGLYAVGGVAGLSLQVASTGSRSWILRARVGGRRAELGLGAFPDVTLSSARGAARELHEQIRAGRNPLEERRLAKEAAQAARYTFREAMEGWLKAKLPELATDRDRVRFRGMLEIHAAPLMSKAVADITMTDVLDVLRPLWETKTETATRLRERVEKIFDHAIAHGRRKHGNPATWRGNLSAVLPAPGKIHRVVNQPALAVGEAPAWWAALAARSGSAALALRFTALSALRSGEVRAMRWVEVDEKGRVLIVPAERTKMRREHRVPLTDQMLEVLEQAKELPGEAGLVFPSPTGKVLSDMALSVLMRKMSTAQEKEAGTGWLDQMSGRVAVPHGLRATFRTWASERTEHPWDLIEDALAHAIGSGVARAYDRGSRCERRRPMMAAWNAYLCGGEG